MLIKKDYTEESLGTNFNKQDNSEENMKRSNARLRNIPHNDSTMQLQNHISPINNYKSGDELTPLNMAPRLSQQQAVEEGHSISEVGNVFL